MTPGPPMREGLRASRIRLDREMLDRSPEPTVLAVLTARFPTDARRLREKADTGEIFDDDGRPLPADAIAVPNSFVHVFRDPPDEPGDPPQPVILYRDNDIIVVDKPHRLATAPRGSHVRHSALVQMRLLTGEEELAPAHRLDRLTAGILLFTRHQQARRDFHLLFQERRVHKEYLAIADPLPEDVDHLARESRIIKPRKGLRCVEMPGPVNAHTEIELLHRGPDAVYLLRPTTGRTHQLRVHMNALGLPIRADPLYPNVIEDPDEEGVPLQLLAASIAFDHPVTGEPIRFDSRRTLALDPRGPGAAGSRESIDHRR
ncbi:pseudouridine synthase [Millisia brevis]|uniref:pseudouridine synthase n=1 Tax=Millisia brevis TaxID=264148 RepID=UPI00082FE685|nr:pseudouridine synthase [Millisia brevis]